VLNVNGGDGENKEEKTMAKRSGSVLLVISLIAFYFAYTSHQKGDTTATVFLVLIGLVLAYLGLKGE
jgi:hypothetical protein